MCLLPLQAFGCRTALHSLRNPVLCILAVALFVLGICSSPAASITNLAQLNQRLARDKYFVDSIHLTGQVFACDTNTGAMILQDSSGVVFLEVNSLGEQFKAGDQIEISADPAFVSIGELGVFLAAPPLVNNDGVHAMQTVSRSQFLKAGRYPVRIDWFNQLGGGLLDISAGIRIPAAGSSGREAAQFRAEKASYFHGSWFRLPNFQMLQPVKTASVSTFDVSNRTRVPLSGIQFDGFLNIPEDGEYLFELTSDDGSRIWLGPTSVAAKRIGIGPSPTPVLSEIGAKMQSLDEVRLSTVEGRVSFVSSEGKGLRLELRSDERSIAVAVASAGSLTSVDLLNARVRISGLAGSVLTEDQKTVLGTLTAVSVKDLSILQPPPGSRVVSDVLKSVIDVHNLSRDVAARRIPVDIRGVVTAVAQGFDRWMVVQDETRGVFVRLDWVDAAVQVGERWEVSGHTQPGDFAPVIVARRTKFLGRGRFPQPARPSAAQLLNGSLDVQWVEFQGVVTGVETNRLALLMTDGRQEIAIHGASEDDLKHYENALVRIRGTLFSLWDAETHEVQIGRVVMHNASISVENPASQNPFDAPEKTPRGLFRFDAEATPLQRVKVRGLVTYANARRVFLEQGSGIEIHSKGDVDFKAGDLVEAVGYPGISKGGPQLREAVLRRIGSAPLPQAPQLSESESPDERLVSTRIQIRGLLVGLHKEADHVVLQIQASRHLYLAYVNEPRLMESLRLGSRLLLTGIYVAGATGGVPLRDAPHFQLLVNSPADVVVLSRPSWWTLPRLLSALGVLLVILALSAIWIAQLRRKVAQRTAQLQEEIRERERIERQHALEAERSRIARDLHDDLGSRLTEINFLASTSGWPSADADRFNTLNAIGERARDLVKALDVIVWAVDPEDNSLQSVADYLSGYAREYLARTPIQCRFKIPMAFPDVTIDGRIRHELLMVVKESLNNILRHSNATEVKFQMSVGEELEISIADNGKGFNAEVDRDGHGLKNCAARLKDVGGSCEIISGAEQGTTVRIRIPLACPAATPKE